MAMARRPTIRETRRETSRAAGVEPPVGTEVRKMSRVQFDRLSEERHWPRGDYDARRGVAEVVAEGMPAHERRAVRADLFVDALLGERVEPARSLRIEWRGSVLEPDGSFYFFAADDGPDDEPGLEPAIEAVVAPGFGDEEACQPEKGHAPPPLVVEINRSSSPVRAAEKRGDYLDMGVQEIWVWRPRDGASIYRRGTDGRPERVPESGVIPGVTGDDLAVLWAHAEWGETARPRKAAVRRVRARRRNAEVDA